MLGATDGAHASIPPKPRELSSTQLRDWKSGVELVKTCMATHDTKTYVSFVAFICASLKIFGFRKGFITRNSPFPAAQRSIIRFYSRYCGLVYQGRSVSDHSTLSSISPILCLCRGAVPYDARYILR
jgi:hypothetical protein